MKGNTRRVICLVLFVLGIGLAVLPWILFQAFIGHDAGAVGIIGGASAPTFLLFLRQGAGLMLLPSLGMIGTSLWLWIQGRS